MKLILSLILFFIISLNSTAQVPKAPNLTDEKEKGGGYYDSDRKEMKDSSKAEFYRK